MQIFLSIVTESTNHLKSFRKRFKALSEYIKYIAAIIKFKTTLKLMNGYSNNLKSLIKSLEAGPEYFADIQGRSLARLSGARGEVANP